MKLHNDGVQALPVERGAAESPGDHEAEGEAADTQPDLPQALQDLLRRLNGSLSPGVSHVTHLSEIYLEHKKFGDFFRQDGRTCPPRTSEVRLKVLQAIGNCKTLKSFDAWRTTGWNLSVTEWEALLVPLQTSAQLEEIWLYSKGHGIAEEEVLIGPHWQKLIRGSRGLRLLSIAGRIEKGLRAKLAAEVASALRPKVHHELEELYFRWLKGMDASVDTVVHVAEIISSAPKLRKLRLDDAHIDHLDLHARQVAREALVTALKGVPQLQELRLEETLGEMIKVLAEAYGGISSSTVLEHLSLGMVDLEPACLEALMSLVRGNISSISLEGGDLFGDDVSSDQWKNLGKCILLAARLRKLALRIAGPWYHNSVKKAENALVQLWDACQESRRLRVTLSFSRYLSHTGLLFLQRALNYSYIESIEVRYTDVGTLDFRPLAKKLGSNSSMERLKLPSCTSSTADGWTNLFGQLRSNTSISVLDLFGCDDLNDDNFRDLMDLLQVNFILREIAFGGTAWGRDGKGALIQEALERNRKQRGYFSVLEQARLPFHVARAGRVFLCGQPFAGKTTLKVSMMKTVSKESKSESLLGKAKAKGRRASGKMKSFLKIRRTKGIEVELLYDGEDATISIWDLAGQEVYRALQNILFPRTSQACIFVLAFNPFQGHGMNGVQKDKVEEAFQRELMSWLRFIVSNTQITGSIRPQLLVLITHKDCYKGPGEFDLTGFITIVNVLRKKFEEDVDLCPNFNTVGPGDTPDNGDLLQLFHVNATDKDEVEPITKSVLCCMKDILKGKNSKVPEVCSALVSHLMKLPKEVKLSPVPLWQSAQFYDFCSTWHSLLKQFQGFRTDIAKMHVLHAVASYMHDVGAVCITPSALLPHELASDLDSPAKLIVVQPNWLSQNLLGGLITSEPPIMNCTDGFTDRQGLITLIHRVLPQHKSMKTKVVVEMVKALLIELDFCHEITGEDGVAKYFMPIILHGMANSKSERETMNKLEWSDKSSGGSNYFGFRVKCRDQERTSLSAAFYPRYQIHLRKKMRDDFQVDDGNFSFSRHHVEIQVQGLFIFVEIDESTTNHIDIMVEYSQNMDRDQAMDYIGEHVVQDLMRFCASDKGCPGVQLVVALLRTECVKRLTPRTLRKNQAILIQDLKRRFQDDVENRFLRGNKNDGLLLGYEHTWPKIPVAAAGFSLLAQRELARTLLSSKDVKDVLMAVKKEHEDIREDFQKLHQVSSQFNDATRDFLLWKPIPKVDSTLLKSAVQTGCDPQYSTLDIPNPDSKVNDDIHLSVEDILRELHQFEKRLTAGMNAGFQQVKEGMAAGFEQVRDDLKILMSNMADMRESMTSMTSMVDSILGLAKSKEDHNYPRRPYFTLEDVSTGEKVKAKLLFGKAVRLHLMCESRHGPNFVAHFVEDQEGLQLLLEKDDNRSQLMRKLSVVSLKMAWIFLKVTVQVTAGLGSVVPDMSSLATGVSLSVGGATASVVLDRLKLEVQQNLPLVEDPKSIEDAWCWLKNYLAPNLTPEKYASLFKLHMMRYKGSDDPYAWLCESCVSSGRRLSLLE